MCIDENQYIDFKCVLDLVTGFYLGRILLKILQKHKDIPVCYVQLQSGVVTHKHIPVCYMQ